MSYHLLFTPLSYTKPTWNQHCRFFVDQVTHLWQRAPCASDVARLCFQPHSNSVLHLRTEPWKCAGLHPLKKPKPTESRVTRNVQVPKRGSGTTSFHFLPLMYLSSVMGMEDRIPALSLIHRYVMGWTPTALQGRIATVPVLHTTWSVWVTMMGLTGGG